MKKLSKLKSSVTNKWQGPLGEKIHDSQKIGPINRAINLISIAIAPTREINNLFAGWNDHITEIKPRNVAEKVKKIVYKARESVSLVKKKALSNKIK